MTKEQWVKDTVKAVEAAGFEIFYHAELPEIPWVKTPPSNRMFEFLKFKFPHPTDRKIYSEGILLLPAGMM